MEYLRADHSRLHQIMARCRDQASRGEMTTAAGTFDQFREGLARHIAIEEEIVFPAFESATGFDRERGPTAAMLAEHRVVLDFMNRLDSVFTQDEPSAAKFESLAGLLVEFLEDHNRKEEQVIYPGTDRAVPPAMLRHLVERMRAY